MRAKDLRKYKTLDITELSGSPWNDAEKVLGLDQDDKVIMAEPDAVVTPEDVDEAINQAMEAETARTEDTYAKKSEVPDLDDYYTKEEVDEAISGITVDLSDYYTKDETDQAISSATQDLASTDYVDDAIAAIPEPDLSDYYTKGETDGAISTALVPYATKGWVSSQSYANQNYVMFKVNEAMQIETARTESTYAKPSDIPSLDDYATEEYVDDAIAAIPPVDLSGYAKTTAVTQDIQSAIASETARTENTYAKPSQIPSLDGYATEQWVESQGYLTEHQDLSAYAKTTAVTEDIQTAMAAETARTESTYLKEHQSLDNYYTKSEVDADFVSAATEVGNAIDAAVDGLASETYVNNAVAGLASEDYVDDAVTAATEGLATQEYVDDAIAGIVIPELPADYATTGDVASAVEGLASESYVDDAISTATQGMATQSDLEGLASESYVDDAVNGVVQGIGMLGMVNDVSESNGTVTVQKTTMQEGQLVTGSTSFNIATPGDIQTAIASETARTESTYLKEHQDISGKLDKTDFNTYTGATETVLAGKLDATAYTIDNALSSSSTNPVENRAVYDALYGTSATTELQVLDTDSNWKMFSSDGNIYPLKNTTIENLKAIYLGDIVPSGNNSTNIWLLDGSDSVYKLTPGQGAYGNGMVGYDDIGNTMFLFATGSTATDEMEIRKIYLDGTYEYYLLFDTEKLGCVVYKNIPTGITEVSNHSAQISDLPTAQDGSNFKQYVYNGGYNDYKRVVSNVVLESTYLGAGLASLIPVLTGWNNSGSKNGEAIKLPAGNEAGTGVKTVRDSVIIDRAEEALSGMTEQVTLTIGSTTTGSQYRIYVNNRAKNLYATNDPRYYVYDLSMVAADEQGYWNLGRLQLGGKRHQISNPYESIYGTNTDGKYQLLQYSSSTYGTLKVYHPGTTKYAIVDVELKTLEITDSLTITRSKNIQQMIGQTQSAITAATQNLVTSGDVATQIGTAMASETARTESTYAKPSQIPSLSGYATETWVQNQGYLTQHQSLAEYYTKTEIDGMIGDIESLLASI